MLYLTCSLCHSISCCPTMWVQHCRCQRPPCPSHSRWIRIRMSRRRHKMENQCLFALTAEADARSGFRHHVMRCASGRPRAGAGSGRGLGLQIDLARAQDTDRQTRTDGLMMDRWSQRSAAAGRLSEVAKPRGREAGGGGPPCPDSAIIHQAIFVV